MAVKALLSYALTVPDLEAGRRFYTTFGLQPEERDNMLAFRCRGRDQDQVHLVEGRRKRLNHLRFAADAAGLADIRARMAANGVEEIAPPHNAIGDGLWLSDPDGNAVNVRIAEPKPPRTAPPVALNTPGHYVRVGAVGCPTRAAVEPHRLGHVLLHTPRLEAMTCFYSDILGMRLSDRCVGIIAFMHVPTGGDHHVVALLNDARPGFHHASFEVGSIDAIGMGAQSVIEAGYRSAWGFGRHVIGSNFFHYLRDPWNSMAEYFCDIDQIPADGSWRPTDHQPADALYRWGPPVPADFAANYEEPA